MRLASLLHTLSTLTPLLLVYFEIKLFSAMYNSHSARRKIKARFIHLSAWGECIGLFLLSTHIHTLSFCACVRTNTSNRCSTHSISANSNSFIHSFFLVFFACGGKGMFLRQTLPSPLPIYSPLRKTSLSRPIF